jgi:cation transport ATPase
MPEEKSAIVRESKRSLHGDVAMVGDGINDAPALASADVGIAMGCGADVSREAADICLLGDDLSRLPWAIELAQQTVRVIRQNLFWAFVFNVAGMGLAVSGHLNPIWASAAMMVSSFLVIGNCARLGADDVRSSVQNESGSEAAPSKPLQPRQIFTPRKASKATACIPN